MPDLDSLVILAPLFVLVVALVAVWLRWRSMPENSARRRQR